MSLGKKSKSQVERLRKSVYERDRYECVACSFLGDGVVGVSTLSIQHRVGRGMGGSALYDKSSAYLITFCVFHNVQETADADFHDVCEENGWSVPRWVVGYRWPIDTVPVRYSDGWFFLVDDSRQQIPEKLAADRMQEIYGSEMLG